MRYFSITPTSWDSATLAPIRRLTLPVASLCTIDKRSSAKLSEAINSMYRGYLDASVCYVFLTDYKHNVNAAVPSDPMADHHKSPNTVKRCTAQLDESLGKCQWFTRGWVLQELIAPRNVYFYDSKCPAAGYERHATIGSSLTTTSEWISVTLNCVRAVGAKLTICIVLQRRLEIDDLEDAHIETPVIKPLGSWDENARILTLKTVGLSGGSEQNWSSLRRNLRTTSGNPMMLKVGLHCCWIEYSMAYVAPAGTRWHNSPARKNREMVGFEQEEKPWLPVLRVSAKYITFGHELLWSLAIQEIAELDAESVTVVTKDDTNLLGNLQQDN
ncbi:hypothetical protein AC579_1372 [Pseudocercospora musae]|uniref:Heterokaryon incompatibility domain-containing protein n=1 Tax=Pseudocercospora musae TaxID=113226 RepID=A0A139IKK5_9PEZI|nr:hypothetical protein AC579_1372 [Pseudocercospora musae]